MSATTALIQSFLKHVRYVALPRPLRAVETRDRRAEDEQRELELWLFDRDSRWR